MASSKTRQRKLARAKMERQQARRAARARRQRQIRAGVVVGLVLVVGLLGGLWAGGVFSTKKKPVAAPTCAWNKPANTQSLSDVGTPPTTGIARTGTENMTITTNDGTVDVALDLGQSPCAAASFAYLAGKNFFNNTTCHRLTTSGSYFLQCGDPKGDGTGGPAYTFADEYLPAPSSATPSASGSASGSASAGASGPASAGASATTGAGSSPTASPSPSSNAPTAIYPRGTVAMYTVAPDTNGSQFFIVYKDSPLPAQYTIIGTVTSGLDVVDKIAAAGTEDGSSDGKPKNTVTVQSLTVTSSTSPSPTPAVTSSSSTAPSPTASPSPTAQS